MYYQRSMRFPEWLDREINDRGWSRKHTADLGDISASMIDKVINGYSNPGLTFYKGIAKAFGKNLFDILRIAGEVDRLPTLDEIEAKFALLSDEGQQQALDYLNFLLEKQEREDRSAQDRKGLAPAER